jgi:hypothetical protein
LIICNCVMGIACFFSASPSAICSNVCQNQHQR